MDLRAEFTPKIFTTLRNYSRKDLFSDITAGIVVGIVAVPLAIAFAIASGVSPDKGLLTAIVAGFLVSLLGGSRVQIGGPTGAFVVIVYGIVHRYGIDGLVVATFLAGILLIAMGLMRLGATIKFIPHPVIVGFTSGIALIIFSSQVKDFFGLQMGTVPSEFIEKWKAYFECAGSFNFYSLLIALGTLVIVAYWPRVSRKIPGSLVALLVFSSLVHFLRLPVETIGSRFGDLPSSLPAPHVPHITFDIIRAMIKPAFTIAMLGGIESLLSAAVSDGMIGGRHRSNIELIAQGLANMVSAAFGGIPATGAIARTVTNIKNGGRTPVSGIIHSLTVLAVVLFLGKWARLIPMPCLAGILVVVSYNMSEWRSFLSLTRGPKSDVIVLLLTFFLTVFFDLTAAIEVGMVAAAFLFIHRMAEVTNVNVFGKHLEEDENENTMKNALSKLDIPEGVEVYEINGPFFFGIAHKFEEADRAVSKKPKVRILRMRNVPAIDATGLHSLKEFFKRCKSNHIHILVSGLHAQPLRVLENSGLYEMIGQENISGSIRDSLKRAQDILSGKPSAPAAEIQQLN